MFKNTSKWSSKKLRWMNILFTFIYFLFSFVAPLLTVIISFDKLSNGNISHKTPLIVIIICVGIILSLKKEAKRVVNKKISITKMDGSFNQHIRVLKHTIIFILDAIVPTALLVLSIMFSTILKAYIDFYVKLIVICMSFYLIGLVVNSFALAFLDDENEPRELLKKNNAAELRKGIK